MSYGKDILFLQGQFFGISRNRVPQIHVMARSSMASKEPFQPAGPNHVRYFVEFVVKRQ